MGATASEITDNSTVCLTTNLFRLTPKESPKLCIAGPLCWESICNRHAETQKRATDGSAMMSSYVMVLGMLHMNATYIVDTLCYLKADKSSHKEAPLRVHQYWASLFASYISNISKMWSVSLMPYISYSRLILGLRPANERRRYKVTPSLIGWAQS